MKTLLISKTNNEKTSYFEKWILNRIKNNQNCLIIMTGDTGSGKSYSAIKLGERLSKHQNINFDINNICFSATDFLNKVSDDNMPKGSTLIFDEIGVEMNARKFHSKVNHSLGAVNQVYRFKNYVVVFCVPNFNFVDKTLRNLIHVNLETTGIDKKNMICWTKPFSIQNNQRSGDQYHKYLRIKIPNEKIMTLKKVGFKKASDEILKDYELKMRDYKNKVISNALKECKQIENDGNLTQRQSEILEYYNTGKKQNEIAEILGIKQSAISQALTQIKKKGYINEKSNFNPF